MLSQCIGSLSINTSGPKLIEITDNVNKWIKANNCSNGLLNLFIMHTSASLIIQENADPDVLSDILEYFSKAVPTNIPYKHKTEGIDDMPAHIKSSITNTTLSLSVQRSKLVLGIWQGIYLFEHRFQVHTRKINLHYLGEYN